MEMPHFFKIADDFHQATQCYIPEDGAQNNLSTIYHTFYNRPVTTTIKCEII
jgi:hypothetical protein